MRERLIDQRETHYQRFFGPLDQQVMHSTDLKPVHIDIYQVAPTAERPFWTLITGGMSDARQPIPPNAPKHVAPRAEILMYAEEPKGWMKSVLKGLAEMPFVDGTYLHWHHTVPNGMPMTVEPSLLEAFFFLPPYFEPEGFDTLTIDGDKVHILMLLPITESERQYAVANGSQALEDLIVKAELDRVVDEARRSLV